MSTHYHTQHAPLGAFASFTIGLPGSRGGFGQSLAGPADENVYVGWRHLDSSKISADNSVTAASAPWHLLPFYRQPEKSAATAFTGDVDQVDSADHTGNASHAVSAPVAQAIDTAAFHRVLGWASDTWRHGEFAFVLRSPFERTADPASMTREAARFAFAPVVIAELHYDNTAGTTPVELMFGIGHTARPPRPLEDATPALAGFAFGRDYGFAAHPADIVRRVQVLDLLGAPASAATPPVCDHRGLHLIGGDCSLVFHVPAGEVRSFPIALGFYQHGVVTTGLSARYYYTEFFRDLEDVLAHGLEHHARYSAIAAARDAELAGATKLNEHQRWLIAQATHSYLGSTELLFNEASRGPLWVVNEGEYRMMNTFDLTVDHLFFELAWHPWAMRNALDLFAARYHYTDEIDAPDTVPGGISFTHDMGVMNHFTLPGRSSYECTGLTGCFSHMTMEQLLNWICCACTYAEKTGDAAWLHSHQSLVLACAESLRRRDHPDAALRTGLLKCDSSRCGPGGAEITTYDSLDVSLGQARNNLYIATKTLAAWALLERAFGPHSLNVAGEAAAARAAADRTAFAIAAQFEDASGMFPAVFEVGNQSRILPAVEGLVFPLYLGWAGELRIRYPDLFQKLSRHMTSALRSGVCIDEASGAWKMSSTSPNTWFSKIALAQHVTRRLFPEALVSNNQARNADAVHALMQQSAPLGRYAMVDQVHSGTGEALGSRYYPRVVTACLWLEE